MKLIKKENIEDRWRVKAVAVARPAPQLKDLSSGGGNNNFQIVEGEG